MRTDWGGFCNSSSGMDYIYNDGNLHQLTDEDWKKYSNIKSRGDDHHSRERNRRTIRAAERDILNKMYEDQVMGRSRHFRKSRRPEESAPESSDLFKGVTEVFEFLNILGQLAIVVFIIYILVHISKNMKKYEKMLEELITKK